MIKPLIFSDSFLNEFPLDFLYKYCLNFKLQLRLISISALTQYP